MCPVGLFFFAQPLDFVLPEHVLQRHAIQIVEVGPRNLALPYFLHRGHVSEPPVVGDLRPVNIQALGLAPTGSFGNYRTAPVDDGAECVKDACFHVGQFGFHGASCRLLGENCRQCGE